MPRWTFSAKAAHAFTSYGVIAIAGDLDFSEDKTAHNWLPGSS